MFAPAKLLIALACFTAAILPSACSPRRSRAVIDEEEQAAAGPRNYKAMLVQARERQVQIRLVEDLETAIAKFQFELARLPTSLVEVVARGYLPDLPKPPLGTAYSYNPVHGNVGLVAVPDPSGLELPSDATNEAPVRLQEVPLPLAPP